MPIHTVKDKSKSTYSGIYKVSPNTNRRELIIPERKARDIIRNRALDFQDLINSERLKNKDGRLSDEQIDIVREGFVQYFSGPITNHEGKAVSDLQFRSSRSNKRAAVETHKKTVAFAKSHLEELAGLDEEQAAKILMSTLSNSNEEKKNINPEFLKNMNQVWSQIENDLRICGPVFSGSQGELLPNTVSYFSDRDIVDSKKGTIADEALDRELWRLGYRVDQIPAGAHRLSTDKADDVVPDRRTRSQSPNHVEYDTDSRDRRRDPLSR